MTRHSADDYAAAGRALLPRGRVWPDDPQSVQGQVLATLGRSFERLDDDAGTLLDQSLPGLSVALIEEWEETLGLPDPCLGPSPTTQQRLNQVRARFVGSGGQSSAWFIAYAALLGFQIEIETFATFRAGHGRAGSPLAGEPWTFVWKVTVLTGSPLEVLECELTTAAPAHTTILFA